MVRTPLRPKVIPSQVPDHARPQSPRRILPLPRRFRRARHPRSGRQRRSVWRGYGHPSCNSPVMAFRTC